MMIGGEWLGKSFENVPPIRDLDDKRSAVGRSKSLHKEKRHPIYKCCRVTVLMSSKSACPGLPLLHHTEGLNLGRLFISFALIELWTLVSQARELELWLWPTLQGLNHTIRFVLFCCPCLICVAFHFVHPQRQSAVFRGILSSLISVL